MAIWAILQRCAVETVLTQAKIPQRKEGGGHVIEGCVVKHSHQWV